MFIKCKNHISYRTSCHFKFTKLMPLWNTKSSIWNPLDWSWKQSEEGGREGGRPERAKLRKGTLWLQKWPSLLSYDVCACSCIWWRDGGIFLRRQYIAQTECTINKREGSWIWIYLLLMKIRLVLLMLRKHVGSHVHIPFDICSLLATSSILE